MMSENSELEKAREFLEKFTNSTESDAVSRLTFPPRRPQVIAPSFYEYLVIKGLRINQFQPGFFSSSFTVPPRLTDENGNLATSAIVTLVDELGALTVHEEGVPPTAVSVDMSISYISPPKMNDELEITARRLGKLGGYSGTSVLIRNKTTGEVVAEGRHSLFGKPSKM